MARIFITLPIMLLVMKMGVLSLFLNPVDAITNAKANKSIGTTILLLIVISLVMGILVGVAMASGSRSYPYYSYGSYRPGVDITLVVGGIFAAFVVVFLGGLFIGLLAKIAVRTLGGTGGYFEGLTSVVYSFFIPSIAILIGGVLMMLPRGDAFATMVSTVIAAILMMWAVVLGAATFYRSLKELFNTDMITAYVGGSVLGAGVAVVYVLMILGTVFWQMGMLYNLYL